MYIKISMFKVASNIMMRTLIGEQMKNKNLGASSFEFELFHFMYQLL